MWLERTQEENVQPYNQICCTMDLDSYAMSVNNCLKLNFYKWEMKLLHQ